jgi:hypothetical protein
MSMQSIFVSYSHTDKKWLDALDPHLKGLEGYATVERFDDRQLRGGDEWRAQIMEAIERADIVLLLVTAKFLASAYIRQVELPAALKRRAEQGCVIIPVLFESCYRELLGIDDIQYLPHDDGVLKPLAEWHGAHRHRGLTQVIRHIHSRLKRDSSKLGVSGTPVTPTEEVGSRPRDSRVLDKDGLSTELRKFARAGELQLDVIAYSTETFRRPFASFFEAMSEADHPNAAVSIRILLKDWTKFFAIPAGKNSNEVQRYREVTAIRNEHASQGLWSFLHSMTQRFENISFEFRLYSLDPFQKGILINRKTAYWNFYILAEGLQAGYENVWDYDGQDVNLIEFRRDGSAAEARVVRSIGDWFDTIWSNDILSREFPTLAQ